MAAPSPFMRRALDEARAVRGRTSPNPWVGAVLVRDGRVISEGATEPPGGAHAEAAALRGVDARGADLYVTLEPCAPFEGKRTPSCARALIDAGVRSVHVALEDHDARVGGRGLAMLREAGIEVVTGDGRDEALALLRPYFKHRETGLPYVIAKYAASLDGKTATRTGESQWITGEAARELAHQQRAWVDAVMVGRATAVHDDPELTARPGGSLASRQPTRIVVDARGSLSPGARLLHAPGLAIVATTEASKTAWRESVEAAGAEVLLCPFGPGGIALDQLLTMLGEMGILSVWAEGGLGLLGSLFQNALVDELWAFIAPRIIGGDGLPAVGGPGVASIAHAHRLRDVHVERIGDDVLIRGPLGSWEPAGAPRVDR